MKEKARLCMFLASAAVFLGLLLWGMTGLPAFGNYRGPYGKVLNAVAVHERHITNLATAVNFDYRGLDTLGEEYILFTAVVGLALLLRTSRGEIEEEPRESAADRDVSQRDHAVRWVGFLASGLTALFGLYVVAHAQLTPGGGFQGGVILGTACLLVYLAIGYQEYKAVSPHLLIETAEAVGAGGYALIGLSTLASGAAFLENVLPLGKTGSLFSTGTVPLINLCVGLEVAGGFVLLFAEFLKETRKRKKQQEDAQ